MATMVPAEVFSPGEIIREELEARDWTQADLAQIMGRPLQAVNEIISAKKRVTEETARELELALGIDAEIWVRTEALYRLHLTGKAPAEIALRAAVRKRAPIPLMVARKWIEPSDDIYELQARVTKFLGVTNLEDRQQLPMAAKQTVYNLPLTPTQEVWLLRAKQMAQSMVVAQYSEDKLWAAEEKLLGLLNSLDDARYVPQILADAGVRFVVVEHLPGLKIQGVCFWLSDDKPVIALSFVNDRIDNFWFVVRHEIEHVLNGEGKTAAIIDNDLEKTLSNETEEEKRANKAAANFCVPGTVMDDFMARKGPLYTDVNIRQFAQSIGRHPGLVAGQLRRRLNAWNRYNKHLARVRHIVVETALVDGFGSTPPLG